MSCDTSRIRSTPSWNPSFSRDPLASHTYHTAPSLHYTREHQDLSSFIEINNQYITYLYYPQKDHVRTLLLVLQTTRRGVSPWFKILMNACGDPRPAKENIHLISDNAITTDRITISSLRSCCMSIYPEPVQQRYRHMRGQKSRCVSTSDMDRYLYPEYHCDPE